MLVDNNIIIQEYKPHTNSVTSILFNPAGNMIVSGSKDRSLEIWDFVNLCQLSSYRNNMKEITGLDGNSSGNLIAIATRSVISLICALMN